MLEAKEYSDMVSSGTSKGRSQSCFLFDALLPEHDKTQELMDTMLKEFAVRAGSNRPPTASPQVCDPEAVAQRIFPSLLPAQVVAGSGRFFPDNMQDAVDMSSELGFVAKSSAGAFKLQPHQSAPPPPPAQRAQPANQRPSVAAAASASAPTASATAATLGGPFKSAKEQFVREGGTLPQNNAAMKITRAALNNQAGKAGGGDDAEPPLPPELEHLGREMVRRIEGEIVSDGLKTTFEDIAGLREVKVAVVEQIIWPINNPELFQGLLKMSAGCLLFGPPGTGKTLIAKALATEVGATFFSISAASIMSKWIGEGEKTVKALFDVARYRTPSIIFVDEIDSLLCARHEGENEATRRMKTEFLVQMDGAGKEEDSVRVVLIGATNRPDEIDDAARRRFGKRIYIPLPDPEAREEQIKKLLQKKGTTHAISLDDVSWIVQATDGFSGADMQALCQDAAMGPVRAYTQKHGFSLTHKITAADLDPIVRAHFVAALTRVQKSVGPSELAKCIEWNKQYGTFVPESDVLPG